MIDTLLATGLLEICVGIAVAIVFFGGIGIYIAYKIKAKKHGKCGCGCDCANCLGCSMFKSDARSKSKASDDGTDEK